MSKIRLHDYMYLDEDLVYRLLSQVDGGLASEEEQSQLDRSGKGASLRVASPLVDTQAGRTRGSESGTSRTIRQTPDSACSRLITVLEEEGLLQYLDAFDQAIWDQLEVGEFLELQTTVEIPMLARLSEMAASFSPFMGMMQAAGQEMDHETIQAMSGIEEFGNMFDRIPVIAKTVGSKHRFIATVKSESIRVDTDDVYGEVRVLGALQRKLGRGETWSMLDAMGFAGLPRNQRRQMEKDLSSARELDVQVIRSPAAVLNPIAIYR